MVFAESVCVCVREPARVTVFHRSLLALIMVSGMAAVPCVAQPTYRAVDLGTLQTGEANSWAWDVNELGEVVGYADAPNKQSIHAFLWADGEMLDLKTLGCS